MWNPFKKPQPLEEQADEPQDTPVMGERELRRFALACIWYATPDLPICRAVCEDLIAGRNVDTWNASRKIKKELRDSQVNMALSNIAELLNGVVANPTSVLGMLMSKTASYQSLIHLSDIAFCGANALLGSVSMELDQMTLSEWAMTDSIELQPAAYIRHFKEADDGQSERE